jgi:glutaredoxin
MKNIVIWTKNNCEDCTKIIADLDFMKTIVDTFDYEERNIDGQLNENVTDIPSADNVPLLVVGDSIIGGFDDAIAWIKADSYR